MLNATMPFISVSNCDESDFMNNVHPLIPFCWNVLRTFVQIACGLHLFTAHIIRIGM